jgi:hypothetical protein
MQPRRLVHRLVPWCALVFCVQPRPAKSQSAARRDAPGTHPVEFSLGTGVLVPFGEEQAGSRLRDQVAAAFPIEFGAGARFFRVLSVGFAGAWGVALHRARPPADTFCGAALQYGIHDACSVRLTRLGGMLAYHPFPIGRWDPWIGAGVAYEKLRFHSRLPVTSSTDPAIPPAATGGDVFFSLNGWLLQSRLGIDYAFAPTLRAGGYLSVDFGRYDRGDVNESRSDRRIPAVDVEFDNKALHAWLGAGVRLVFLGP